MRAMKCDRCGKLYEFYMGSIEFKNNEISNGIILVDRVPDGKWSRRKDIDFCFECMQELVSWLKEDTGHGKDQNH